LANRFLPMSSDTPQKSNDGKIWRVLLTGYWLAIVVATHVPPNFPGLPGDRIDKLVHVAAFAGLAWLLAMAWEQSSGKLTARHLGFAWLVVVLFAAIDEVTQPLVGRLASRSDWLADALGAATGLFVFTLTRRLFETE
jgi:VanZ family protein